MTVSVESIGRTLGPRSKARNGYASAEAIGAHSRGRLPVSDAGIACRHIGPINIVGNNKDGEGVFDERRRNLVYRFQNSASMRLVLRRFPVGLIVMPGLVPGIHEKRPDLRRHAVDAHGSSPWAEGPRAGARP
jgi:hypothetical protein